MKKRSLLILIGIVIIIALIIRYGFLIIFWFTTPKGGEISQNEKILFQKIKNENKATNVWREPKYNIINPKDTIVYRIIINNLPCTGNTLNLKSNSLKIKERIYSLNLHKNFYKYDIIYQCKDGEDIRYSYFR